MRLWYNQEAQEWLQALPIGNGHMGAMVYGGASGRFDLSENACWSGAREELPLREGAGEAMKSAREALLAGEYGKAEQLLEKCTGVKKNYGTQVPMGRLTVAVLSQAQKCIRELELETGLAREEFVFTRGVVRRESFLSNPDKVMGVRLSGEGVLPPLCLWLEGWSQPCKTRWDEEKHVLEVQGLGLENIHSDGLHGVSYRILLFYDTDGEVQWNRQGPIISRSTYLVVFLTAATDLFEEDPMEVCRFHLEGAVQKGWEAVKADHVADHSEGMGRCSFTMPDGREDLPTDLRIRAFAEAGGGDDGLIALFFQYGRYLLFNSSRPDSLLPAALQGIWNDDRACRMEWTDDMHLDINTQMNYYPAENTGLGDCTMPLFQWIKKVLAPEGAKMARALYGMEGWCAHTVSNAHGFAAPGWDVGWGFTITGGAWIATHIWEHYLYTEEKAFLEEYYDVLYESARFLKDTLMEDPDSGELLVTPSYSPENVFSENGVRHCLAAGGTFDTTVARAMFSIVRKAAVILGREDAFTSSLAEVEEKLPPYRVGRHGQLMEWYRDFDEPLPDHRHTSHLLALHPFNAIDPTEETALGEAVRVSLKRRLGENADDIVCANWSGALLILYYARLLDREKAGEFVKPMIAHLSRDNMMITHQGPSTSVTGGIYELDGNTGFTAGVGEMLLQSYTGVVHILPGVPADWKKGAFQGMRTYGGHSVSAQWDERSIEGSVTAGKDGEIRLRCYGSEKTVYLRAGESARFTFKREMTDNPPCDLSGHPVTPTIQSARITLG